MLGWNIRLVKAVVNKVSLIYTNHQIPLIGLLKSKYCTVNYKFTTAFTNLIFQPNIFKDYPYLIHQKKYYDK
jgi:hypothetical protein